MAPKRSTPVEDSSAAVSSSEEEVEEESSSEEEVTSSEEEQEEEETPPPQSSQTKTNPKSQTAKSPVNNLESDSDSVLESDSDAESESEPDPDNQPPKPNSNTVKPVATKPNKETSKKPTTDSEVNAAIPAAKSTPAKRGSKTEQDPNNSKRSKKVDDEKSEDSKRQLFQRLFSEEDEVNILQGFIEFNSKKGSNPYKDITGFHDFIKKSVKFDVSVSQLKDKLDRLKKKFNNNLKRGKMGSNLNPHEKKIFNLSNQIWGSEATNNGAESSVKSIEKTKNARGNGKKLSALKIDLAMDDAKGNGADKVSGMEIDRERNSSKYSADFDVIVAGNTEQLVLNKGLDNVDEAMRAEMEEEWRKLHLDTLELFVRRNELIGKQAKLLLDVFKNMK